MLISNDEPMKSAKTAPPVPGEAKLTSRDCDNVQYLLRQKRLRVLMQQCAQQKLDTVNTKKREASAREKYESFCSDTSNTKVGFKDFIQKHNLLHLPPHKSGVCWIGKKKRQTNALEATWEERLTLTVGINVLTVTICEELRTIQKLQDHSRSSDLEPQDALDRELRDDVSNEDSDWYGRTGQPLFCVEEIESNKKPNNTLASTNFGKGKGKVLFPQLPAVYTVGPEKYTHDQKLSAAEQDGVTRGGDENTTCLSNPPG